MDFGADFNNYDVFNCALPADAEMNKTILSRGTGIGHIYLGLPKWGNKHWIGRLYPKGTLEKDFLDEYAKNFNAIELCATHYRIHPPEQFVLWKEKADNDLFLFCPKFPQIISHYSRFEDTHDLTVQFLTAVSELGENLGPIFLQVSDKLSPKRLASLLGYVATLPKELQFFVEVRHEDWFSDRKMFNFLTDGLSKFGVGLIITDTPGRRDLLHMTLTVPKLFLRYVGMGNTDTDRRRILNWRDRIVNWKRDGLSEAFVFLHLHDEYQSISFAQEVKRMLDIS